MGFPWLAPRVHRALQDRELDEIVARIGDAFLARLGGGTTTLAPPAAKPIACACEHGSEDASSTTDAAVLPWEPQALELALLDGEATEREITSAAAAAGQLGVAAVIVLPAHVKTVERALRGSSVRVVAVAGYPHGASAGPLKLAEAELALGQGADEIEWTAPLGALREGADDLVFGELRAAVEMAHAAGAVLCFSVEMHRLDQGRKLTAAVIGRLAGADGVGVVAGRAGHGRAEPGDVALMKRTVGDRLRIKACGGSDSRAAVGALVSAGADVVVISDPAAFSR